MPEQRCHQRLLPHALVTLAPDTETDDRMSLAALVVTKALSPTTPMSLFGVADETGVALGAAQVGVHDLYRAGLVHLSPTIAPGTAAAREVAPRLGSLRPPIALTATTASAKIAVAGRWAEALVHAVGGRVRVLRARMMDRECVVRTVCLSAGDAAVHVMGDATAHYGELWLDLVRGALGVVVTVDRAYEEEAQEVIWTCHRQGVAYVVAVVEDGLPQLELVGWARATLPLDDDTPVVQVNLGDRSSVMSALAMLEEPCLAQRSTTSAPQNGGR